MGLVGTRWTRFGKDRTYFVDEAGDKVGWADNLTGAITGEREGGADEVRAWLAEAGEAHPAEDVSDQPEARGQVVEEPEPRGSERPALLPTDVDLALNRPGQATRERAQVEYDLRRAEVGRFRAWAQRKLDIPTDERSWRIGADAEETVGAELERLTYHGWRVLHSIPVGERGSDIDHLLIGPGGVITVNTKHHPGGNVWVVSKQVRVNGQPVSYLRNSRFEAGRASRLLGEKTGIKVDVLGCLIFRLGDGSLYVKEEPGDVLVFRATEAYGPLSAAKGVLTSDEAERLFEAARWRSTWIPV